MNAREKKEEGKMETILMRPEISLSMHGPAENGLAILVMARRITAQRGQALRNGSSGQMGNTKPGQLPPPAARTGAQHRAWIYEQVERAIEAGGPNGLMRACMDALVDYRKECA
jgi:hypothetical protein